MTPFTWKNENEPCRGSFSFFWAGAMTVLAPRLGLACSVLYFWAWEFALGGFVARLLVCLGGLFFGLDALLWQLCGSFVLMGAFWWLDALLWQLCGSFALVGALLGDFMHCFGGFVARLL